MKFAITFGQLHPAYWLETVREADRLGYESAWLPEHLVFPVEMRGQLVPGEEHPPVPPSTPVYEPGAYLSFVAAQTTRIRLGTFVYLLGIRHPFVGARAFATLDVLSGGRAEVGVGAGWMTTEWEAVGLDPATRGRRLDEAIEVCKRLWTEEVIEHHGEFFDFAPVMFEPKPVQHPHPPIVVGGESDRALRRAARLGDGWIGMSHTPESVVPQVRKLRAFEEEYGRADRPVQVTVMGAVRDPADLERWAEAGVDRLIVVPWTRSREAVDGLRRFADDYLR
ncbi:LLM class F420-dependent oxidoreductase [Rhabdothermincola sediminis]|uniref:LLM class F420-dependent oxidoreductase n=1 Tax=Rhabdothermincola sediminis TaxID=2751370 RepID=UPI001AA03253|nr:LLM class F420-dependent oxidoreductase [Rhabdothermincola sediminis]